MQFDQDEKIAVVKAIAETIDLDEKYMVGELMYLDELMETLDFDAKFMEKAKQLSSRETVRILQNMSMEKKRSLIVMIDKMTKADGSVHKKEKDFIVNLINTLH